MDLSYCQKTIFVSSIIYKGGLKRWFNPGNRTFIDISFGFFSRRGGNVELIQFTVLEYGNPVLFAAGFPLVPSPWGEGRVRG
jgi:hypothetical protein